MNCVKAFIISTYSHVAQFLVHSEYINEKSWKKDPRDMLYSFFFLSIKTREKPTLFIFCVCIICFLKFLFEEM